MKQRNRIWIYPSMIIMGFLLLLATSCEKDSSSPDYASAIAGTYYGTVTVVGSGSVSGSSKLTRSSDKVVNLVITIGSSSIPLNGIAVSKSGSNYYLNYTDASGSFSGTVSGNSLTWTLTDGSDTITFSGTG
jgi:hypothetical protein